MQPLVGLGHLDGLIAGPRYGSIVGKSLSQGHNDYTAKFGESYIVAKLSGFRQK